MPNKSHINEELLEQIYNYSITCIVDNDLSIIFSSESFDSLTGYNKNKPGELNALQTADAYSFIVETLKKRETWKGEIKISSKKKQTIYLDTTIKPVISNSSENYNIASFIDISQRKQLIENLKKRAHRQGLVAILGQLSLNNIPIQDLLEQTLAVICGSLEIDTGIVLEIPANDKNLLVRANYNFSYLSKTVITLKASENDMLHYTLDNGQPVICESINNETRFKLPKEFTQETYNSATCLLIGDKKHPFGILTLLTKKTRTINIDEIHFLQSVCNILTEAINRYKMEQALIYEQELSKNYLNAAEIVFIVLNTDNNIILANRYAASILGYSQEKLIGMNFVETFIPTSDKDSVKNHFKTITAKDKKNANQLNTQANVTPIINKNNQIRKIRWKHTPLLDEHRNITSILSAGEDITEILKAEENQKILEAQLHKAQKTEAIGMLAGGMAHDFNNILASILGFSELAFEILDENDTRLHKYLTQIQNSGIKARDIIAQLQSINLQDEPPDTAILLPSLLKGTLSMLRSALPTSIHMMLDIHNDIPAVKINAPKFNQIVMHLLTGSSNTLKGKGEIKISLKMEEMPDVFCTSCSGRISGKHVVLTVHDNGPGINENIFPELFSDKHSKSNSGLPFVNNIIHDSQGHILITNKHLNNTENTTGTSIKLIFKTKSAAPTNESHKANELNLSHIINKHVMIIDDENSVASYMGELFRSTGFKASVFCDPVEALEAFKIAPDDYDLIISDQTMPIITGDILAGHMLEIKPELPIIICTGHGDILDGNKADRLKIKKLLQKPVNSAELLNTVVNLLTTAE